MEEGLPLGSVKRHDSLLTVFFLPPKELHIGLKVITLVLD